MVSLSKYLIVLYSPFHFQEVLNGFSLAYKNCQHHDSHALGSLLSKTRVTLTQHCDTRTADLISQTITKWLTGRSVYWVEDMLDYSRSGWEILIADLRQIPIVICYLLLPRNASQIEKFGNIFHFHENLPAILLYLCYNLLYSSASRISSKI